VQKTVQKTMEAAIGLVTRCTSGLMAHRSTVNLKWPKLCLVDSTLLSLLTHDTFLVSVEQRQYTWHCQHPFFSCFCLLFAAHI